MKSLLKIMLITILFGCTESPVDPEAEVFACNAENPMEMSWLQTLIKKAETDPKSTLYLSRIYQYEYQSGYVFHLIRTASSSYPHLVDCDGKAVSVFNDEGEITNEALLDLIGSNSGKIIWEN